MHPFGDTLYSIKTNMLPLACRYAARWADVLNMACHFTYVPLTYFGQLSPPLQSFPFLPCESQYSVNPDIYYDLKHTLSHLLYVYSLEAGRHTKIRFPPKLVYSKCRFSFANSIKLSQIKGKAPQTCTKRKNQVAVWGWSHSAEVRVQNQWAELISSNIKLGLATRPSSAGFRGDFFPKSDCMRKAEGSRDISYRKRNDGCHFEK